MRAALVLVIALSAGCHEDAVLIDVRPGATSAVRVELFVMDKPCVELEPALGANCNRLKTPSSASYVSGEVYTRRDGTTFAADIIDGEATFRIVPDGTDTRVPLGIAVGYDFDDKIVGAVYFAKQFEANEGNRRILTLAAVDEDPAVTGAQTSPGVRVETWAQPNGDGSCVAFQAKTANDSTSVFIVPADDLDCDSYTSEVECDAFWQDFSAPQPRINYETCDVSVGNGQKACILSSPGCSDGGGTDCAPRVDDDGNAYCVPSALCESQPQGCKDIDGNTSLCVVDKLKHVELNPGVSRLRCKVPVETFNPQSNQTCGGQPKAVTIPSNVMPSGVVCQRATVGPVGIPRLFLDQYAGVQNNVDVSVTAGCSVRMVFSEQFALNDVRYLDDWLLKVDLENHHSLLVPLEIDLVQSCPNDAFCYLERDGVPVQLDESLAACGRL